MKNIEISVIGAIFLTEFAKQNPRLVVRDRDGRNSILRMSFDRRVKLAEKLIDIIMPQDKMINVIPEDHPTEVKRWLSPYETCDLCGTQIKGVEDYFVDGETFKGGTWGLMCPKCHREYGSGLGLGKGQKYDGHTGILIDGDK